VAIEGTGIKSPSKKAERMAMATYRVDPLDKLNRDIEKNFRRLSNQESTGAVKETGRGMGDRFNPFADRADARLNFFSPGGGAFDERNNVQVASAGDFSGTFDEGDFKNYTRALGIKNIKRQPDMMQRMLRENYQMDKKEGIYRDGQIFNRSDTLLNKAPVKEKPSFVEQTKNLAGSIFNTITGTQPAAASQIPGGMPTSQTQFSSSNLDAAKASGDTSFASYRMGGGEQQNQSGTVVSPTATVSPTRPQYEINRSQNRPSVSGAVNKNDTSFSSYVRSGGEGQKRGNVSPASIGAPRQTVASLPSNYKKTEAESFRKAAAFKEAQGIAKRNPNVRVGVDSKGQPRATATNNSGVARAQAMAVNRKLSGTKPKSAKERAQDAAKARRKAGPNRTMSDGQKTRAQAGASARTAQGNRARVRSNARKRAQAAARRRRAKKKKCDIFLKYNISPLTNMNLLRDDLAEVAYFVKEIQK